MGIHQTGHNNFARYIDTVGSFIALFYGSRGRVDFGTDSDKKLAGGWFVRLLSKRRTGFKVIVNSLLERVFQLTDCLTMETDNISNTDDTTNKNMVVRHRTQHGRRSLCMSLRSWFSLQLR